MVTIERVTADEWDLWRPLRLAALADAPEAFGSKLADWTGDGDTEERWRARLDEVPVNLVARLDGEPAGIVSLTEDAELISMWVAPRARGRGVGDALIDALLDQARERGLSRVVLAVRLHNDHARRAYERAGFAEDGWHVAPPDPEPERRMVRRL